MNKGVATHDPKGKTVLSCRVKLLADEGGILNPPGTNVRSTQSCQGCLGSHAWEFSPRLKGSRTAKDGEKRMEFVGNIDWLREACSQRKIRAVAC